MNLEERMRRALITQFDAINISAKAFDEGFKGEAVRIANSVFILLGQKMRNHTSILEHLGHREALRLPSTVHLPDSSTPLFHARATKVAETEWTLELIPIGIEKDPRPLSLNDWWNEVFLKDDQGRFLTRETLIRSVRDQDGGAHLDEELSDANYKAVIAGEFGGFHYKRAEDAAGQAVPFAIETTVRQIGNEVLFALNGLVQKIETPPV